MHMDRVSLELPVESIWSGARLRSAARRHSARIRLPTREARYYLTVRNEYGRVERRMSRVFFDYILDPLEFQADGA